MSVPGYAVWSVVSGEQPTVAAWNILGSNDAAFNAALTNNGTGFFYIGTALIQYTSASVTISATNTSYSWNINWPKAFNTVGFGFVSVMNGYSLGELGGGKYEVLTTSAIAGYVENTTSTGTAVVNVLGIGT